MAKRHLEKVRVLIKDATGLDISYAYDDLVFPEHTAFLVQFDDTDDNNFFCYFHEECVPAEQDRIFERLSDTCKLNNCTLVRKGAFNLAQKGQSVEIRFLKGA